MQYKILSEQLLTLDATSLKSPGPASLSWVLMDSSLYYPTRKTLVNFGAGWALDHSRNQNGQKFLVHSVPVWSFTVPSAHTIKALLHVAL